MVKRQEVVGTVLVREYEDGDVALFVNVFGVAGGAIARVGGEPGVDRWERGIYLAEAWTLYGEARSRNLVKGLKWLVGGVK